MRLVVYPILVCIGRQPPTHFYDDTVNTPHRATAPPASAILGCDTLASISRHFRHAFNGSCCWRSKPRRAADEKKKKKKNIINGITTTTTTLFGHRRYDYLDDENALVGIVVILLILAGIVQVFVSICFLLVNVHVDVENKDTTTLPWGFAKSCSS